MADTGNKACVLLKEKTVEIRDVPMPTVGPDDVLVKVESTGICGSDVRVLLFFPGPDLALRY